LLESFGVGYTFLQVQLKITVLGIHYYFSVTGC